MSMTQAGGARRKAVDWELVLERIEQLASLETLPDGSTLWRADQDRSLRWMARQLRKEPGVLVADEVGLGKTRLALALAVCVAASGGRVAVLIPPGLAWQWQDEELTAFLMQLSELSLPWLKDMPVPYFLRTYADLYGERCSYPLANAFPILFVSHGFGLPPVGRVVKQELWALPFLVKKQADMSAYGAGTLTVSAKQQEAAAYVGKYCRASLRRQLELARLGAPAPNTFKDEQFAALFQKLIGELLGDFDLLILDEAHKSRAGSDLTVEEKQVEGKLRSRLTKLLEHILLARPRNVRAKRLALTATPMELNVEQWEAIFSRLGLGDKRVAELGAVVKGYADAVEGLRAGSQVEVDKLKSAADEFRKKLQSVVTRRVWRDHPIVKRYSEKTHVSNRAHPHRDYIPYLIRPEDLTQADRRKLALSEALAAAARGASVGHKLKTAGMRFSQALPQLPEATQDVGVDEYKRNTTEQDGDSNTSKDAVVELPARARMERCKYWREVAAREDREQLGEVVDDARHALQWHPRVRETVRLIENLSARGNGEKILVFGEFLASLQALNRSLNIRHYLRHMRDGKPIPLPQGVRAAEHDVRRWRLDPEFRLAELNDQQFEKRAANSTAKYEREREQLRDVCSGVVKEAGLLSQLSPELVRVLTTWLVQQLCVEDLLWAVDDLDGRDSLRKEVCDRLASLRDPDPPNEDEPNAQRELLSWTRTVEQLKDDLQRNDAGEYVFRMSAFAQLMIGDTKAATRRARQSTFNHPRLNPRVLLGQSDVMSEGLNLHRACRTVVLFHLDWNPGRIEQQIGRVDRENSAWMQACEHALDSDSDATPPKIEVYTLAVEGTYDDLRSSVVKERMELLRAQLFGEILPLERLALLPPEAQQQISKIEIDFRPDP
ncbi:Helicase conserved C-terminal domain-containing protein [Burkholderia sp. D7]|nr:Helicase conserved C-terminal domain-containing protein [Burkholderia sp. D7]